MASSRLLDPKLDVVFKLLFGNPRNRALLISLLNAVLHLPERISSVEVLNPELPKEAIHDKGIVLDLLVRLANRREINVEMQCQPRAFRRERALYNWARLYGARLTRGDDYSELAPCAVVFIFDFIEFEGQRFHSTFHVRNDEDGKLCDHLELHFIELPKLARAARQNDEPLLRAWGKFLIAQSETELEELSMVDPVFREALDALESLSADPEARRWAEDREAQHRFYRAELNMARRQAKTEGFVEGKTEGFVEGKTEGFVEGKTEGFVEGKTEGFVEGKTEGFVEGKTEGFAEGKATARAAFLLRQLTRKFGELPADVCQRVESATEIEHARWADRVLFESSLSAVFEA